LLLKVEGDGLLADISPTDVILQRSDIVRSGGAFWSIMFDPELDYFNEGAWATLVSSIEHD
jgi:hypothetical protein